MRVMFICLGNICRSPAAEGMLAHLAKEAGITDLHCESSGVGDWHAGQLPDLRMREAAEKRGIVLCQRAKQFKSPFFEQFDYLFAVNKEVMHYLYKLAHTPEQKNKVQLFTRFSEIYPNEDIPDPYYSSEGDFEVVLDMLEDACLGFLQFLRDNVS